LSASCPRTTRLGLYATAETRNNDFSAGKEGDCAFVDLRGIGLSEGVRVLSHAPKMIGPPPKPIPVTFRRLTEVPEGFSILRPAKDIPEGQNLYELDLPEGAVTGTVRFRLGSNGLGPHRLLLYPGKPTRSGRSGEPYVLDLTGEPRVQPRLPDRPWPEQFKLFGDVLRAGRTVSANKHRRHAGRCG
jgi:hypothetical protein